MICIMVTGILFHNLLNCTQFWDFIMYSELLPAYYNRPNLCISPMSFYLVKEMDGPSTHYGNILPCNKTKYFCPFRGWDFTTDNYKSIHIYILWFILRIFLCGAVSIFKLQQKMVITLFKTSCPNLLFDLFKPFVIIHEYYLNHVFDVLRIS